MRNSSKKPSSRKSTRKPNIKKPSVSKNVSILPKTPLEPRPNHLIYFLNIMAETRISNYFLVASDVTSIFKTSTEKICDSIGRWKSRESDDDNNADFHINNDSEKLTAFGSNVVRIGEILGTLQAEDPISFASNYQTELILGSVIPLAKDVVKLKRKLLRISDAVMPDLKEFRNLVEVHGLLSSPAENEVNVNEDFGNYVESVTDTAMESLSQKPSIQITSKNKDGFPRLIHFIRNIFSKKNNSKPASNSEVEETKSKSQKSTTSEEFEIKPPSEKPSEKHLQKIASTLATHKQPLKSVDYILDNTRVKVKDESENNAEMWERMEETMKIDDDDDVKPGKSVHSVDSPLVVENLNDDEVKSILEQEAAKFFPRKELPDNKIDPEPQNDDGTDTFSIQFLSSGQNGNQPSVTQFQHFSNSNNSDQQVTKLDVILDECEKTLDSIGITTTRFLPPSDQVFGNSELLSGEQHIDKKDHPLSEYRKIVDQMHRSTTETINQIREIEQSWMNTTTKAVGFQNFLKVGDMLDYALKTVHLLGDAQFIEQIYPETKSDVLKGVEQIYREFHSCFIAVGELAEMVSTDVIYLRELMDNLPKGDPIVYEFTSNSSLGSFDQIEAANNVPTGSNFVFDVEAIFG